MRIEFDFEYSTKEFKNVSAGFTKNKCDIPFTALCTDSREVKKSDLFISLAQNYSDSEEHIKEAKAKGAITVSALSKNADFLVSDTETALLNLAALHKSKLKRLKSTVAITGSVGKTTTKEFCAALFSSQYKVHKTHLNQNNALGLSFSLLSAKEDTEILVLEMGMNHLGEIKRLSNSATPDLAVITNIYDAHIGNLGSRKMIAKAKMEIVSGMKDGALFYPYGEELITLGNYSFSTSESSADYFLKSEKDSSTLYRNKEKILTFKTKALANHYKSAILIALSLSDKLGFTEAEMQAGVKNFEKIELRQKLIVAGGRFIYDDTYSSSPEAVRADLEFLKLNFPDKKINAALGDMLELGCETEAAHRKIGSFAKDFGVERLYAFGSYSSLIKEGALDRGFDKEKIYTSDEEDFYVKIAREILKDTTPDEITLIKASHAIKSERIIEELERQYKNA